MGGWLVTASQRIRLNKHHWLCNLIPTLSCCLKPFLWSKPGAPLQKHSAPDSLTTRPFIHLKTINSWRHAIPAIIHSFVSSFSFIAETKFVQLKRFNRPVYMKAHLLIKTHLQLYGLNSIQNIISDEEWHQTIGSAAESFYLFNVIKLVSCN